jgi:hypothetical protein
MEPCPQFRSDASESPQAAPSLRWTAIITIAILMLIGCYLAAAVLAIPYFADLNGRFGPWYPRDLLGDFAAVGFYHLVANILLSVEEKNHPIRWLSFVGNCALYIILPAIPLAGILVQIPIVNEPFSHVFTERQQILCEIVLICPIVAFPIITFRRLRTLAIRFSKPTLACQIAIVAVGDAVSLAFFAVTQLLCWSRIVPDVLWNNLEAFALLLLPRALLMVFSLWSLYVLFEMAGHLLTYDRRAIGDWIVARTRPQSSLGIE